MKTNISLMPKGAADQSSLVMGEASELRDQYGDQLVIESDTSYVANVKVGSKTYIGSLRSVIEQSQTNAGVRRLLMKVELPLVPPSSSTQPGNGCCCGTGSDDGAAPMVTAHVVLTLPAEVAHGVARNDSDACDRVSAAIRTLQSLLAGATSNTDVANAENATLAAGVLTLNDSNERGYFKPFATYDRTNSDIVVHDPVDADAPIWGLVGGLKQL